MSAMKSALADYRPVDMKRNRYDPTEKRLIAALRKTGFTEDMRQNGASVLIFTGNNPKNEDAWVMVTIEIDYESKNLDRNVVGRKSRIILPGIIGRTRGKYVNSQWIWDAETIEITMSNQEFVRWIADHIHKDVYLPDNNVGSAIALYFTEFDSIVVGLGGAYEITREHALLWLFGLFTKQQEVPSDG